MDTTTDGGREVARRNVDALIAEMRTFEIKTDEDYRFLDDWRRRAKETEKAVDAAFESERAQKKAAYDAVLEAKRVFKVPLGQALAVVDEKMTKFVTEREKARRDAEVKARDEARKRAEDDRIAQAENLQAMGRQDAADELLDKRLTVRAVDVEAVPEKLGKTMEKWTVSVVDKSAFLKFAAIAHPSISDCVTVETAKLARLAQAGKGLSAPGLVVEQTFVPVA